MGSSARNPQSPMGSPHWRSHLTDAGWPPDTADTTVHLWRSNFSEEPVVFRAEAGFVYAVAFTPDSQTLAVGTVDGLVKMWNVRSRREVTALEAHHSIVSSIAFSPDRRTMATVIWYCIEKMADGAPGERRRSRKPAIEARASDNAEGRPLPYGLLLSAGDTLPDNRDRRLRQVERRFSSRDDAAMCTANNYMVEAARSQGGAPRPNLTAADRRGQRTTPSPVISTAARKPCRSRRRAGPGIRRLGAAARGTRLVMTRSRPGSTTRTLCGAPVIGCGSAQRSPRPGPER